MSEVSSETLAKIEQDIKSGDLGKARDRLHGLISTYPNELWLRKMLGDIYDQLQYPAMAGRYWYLESEKTTEMAEACRQFERTFGNNTHHIVRALKFKGDRDVIEHLPIHIENEVTGRVKDQLLEDVGKETLKDKLLGVGCLLFIVILLGIMLVGLYTVGQWIF
ncbi:DUF6584 family protein [Priestia koreensis]|uniref:DUF6584 family protein n=1 Tax=Priestia koreensis TaxID=284581 RepID=UPI003D01D4EA